MDYGDHTGYRTRLEPGLCPSDTGFSENTFQDIFGKNGFIHIEHSLVSDTGRTAEINANLVAGNTRGAVSKVDLGAISEENKTGINYGRLGWSFDYISSNNDRRYDIFFTDNYRNFAILGVQERSFDLQIMKRFINIFASDLQEIYDLG